MIRSTKVVGLTLAAVFAFCAMAASSAFAAGPQYMSCAKAAKVGKTYTGKYTNKQCSAESAKSEGKYERVAVKTPDKFKAKGGAEVIYLYNPKEPPASRILVNVGCKTSSDEGEIVSSTEAKLKITQTGCEIPPGRALVGKCNSPGAPEGTVITEELASKLVFTNEAETEVGVNIKPASGEASEHLVCAGAEFVEVTGSEVGKIGPLNAGSKTLTVSLVASTETGEPELSGFYEGGLLTPAKLLANLTGFVSHPEVPLSHDVSLPQKGGEVLIVP